MNTDKLDRIFAMQRALDADIAVRRDLHFSREEWIQKGVLAMFSELAEVLDETRFEWWKKPRPIDNGALKEELVDVLHFFIGTCIRSGMDADELFRLYAEKNRENYNRQHGMSQKPGYEVE